MNVSKTSAKVSLIIEVVTKQMDIFFSEFRVAHDWSCKILEASVSIFVRIFSKPHK